MQATALRCHRLKVANSVPVALPASNNYSRAPNIGVPRYHIAVWQVNPQFLYFFSGLLRCRNQALLSAVWISPTDTPMWSTKARRYNCSGYMTIANTKTQTVNSTKYKDEEDEAQEKQTHVTLAKLPLRGLDTQLGPSANKRDVSKRAEQ